jgi:hypothetical protein
VHFYENVSLRRVFFFKYFRFPRQYYSINASYSHFINSPLALYNLSNGERQEIKRTFLSLRNYVTRTFALCTSKMVSLESEIDKEIYTQTDLSLR